MIVSALARWEIPVTPQQVDRLRAHFAMLLEANRLMNLTRITDPLEAAVKHYVDSLALLPWAAERRTAVRTVLDLGTGGGFPAVPLAIMRPDWSITAIDATGKKIDFVAHAAATLEIANLHAEHAHSEHWKSDRTFDVVVARAVGPLERCLKAGARFLAAPGRLVVYKTRAQADLEAPAVRQAVRTLRLTFEGPYCYQLFLREETFERALLIYCRRKSERPPPRKAIGRRPA